MRYLASRRRTVLVLAVFTALNLGLGGVLWSLLTPAPHLIQGRAFSPLVGHPAPNVTFTPWNGQTLQLAALKGHPVVLNFWASWCDPCRQEAPVLESAWQQHQREGVLLLGVDYHDTASAAQQFLRTYSITYPNGPDVADRISASYAVSNIPITVFIDRSGTVVRTILGQLDPATLEGAIQQLLSQPQQTASMVVPFAPTSLTPLDHSGSVGGHYFACQQGSRRVVELSLRASVSHLVYAHL